MVSTYNFFLSAAKKEILPVYLFCGTEDFLIDIALQQVKKIVLSANETEFNTRLFYGEEANSSQIITEAETMPFLAQRRLIIVKNAAKLTASEIDEIVAYLEKPAEFSCLVLVDPAITSSHKLYKAVARQGMVVEFQAMRGRELDQWLESRAAQNKKSLEPGAGRVIRDRVGDHLRELDRAMETVCAYVGHRKQIKAGDVEKAVGQTYLLDIFKLVDAVGAKKADEALEALHQLKMKGAHEVYCLSMLTRQLRLIRECRLAQEKGVPSEKLISVLKVHPYVLKKIITQAEKFKTSELKQGFRSLLEADTKIKTGQLNPRLVLECLILKLCSTSS